MTLMGCVGLSVFSASPALAATVVRPAITPTQSSFTVPAGKTLTWTLRLWSHGKLLGSSAATSGLLVVAVPHQSDCTFQADVTDTAAGGSPQYYSGSRVTMTSCGVAPPTQTIAGHIYLCTPGGSPTTTEVDGGTLSATGPQSVSSQANPLVPTTVNSGTYTMTAGTPSGFLLVGCGGSALPAPDGLTATESLLVPSGGSQVGLFYVSAPPVGAGGGSTVPNEVNLPTVPTVPGGSAGLPAPVPIPAAFSSGHSPTVKSVPVAGSHLAFTGMNVTTPLLLGAFLLLCGLLLTAVSRTRRPRDLVPVVVTTNVDG